MGISTGEIPATQKRPGKTSTLRKQRHLINPRRHKSIPVIQRRKSPFSAQVLEILYASWRQYGRKHLCCRVIDQFTIRVSSRHLETARKAFAELNGTTMVRRIPVRQKRSYTGAIKT